MKSSLVTGAGAAAASEASRGRSLQLLVRVSTVSKLSSEEEEEFEPSVLGLRDSTGGVEAVNGRTAVPSAVNSASSLLFSLTSTDRTTANLLRTQLTYHPDSLPCSYVATRTCCTLFACMRYAFRKQFIPTDHSCRTLVALTDIILNSH